MSQTILEFFTDTAVLVGSYGPGETLSPEDLAMISSTAEDLLEEWNIDGLSMYQIAATLFALSASAGSYPIGAAAAPPFNVARPLMIESANVLTTGPTTAPLEIVSAVEWAGITEKAMTAKLPLKLYCDYAYPVSRISVWPVPSANCQIELFAWGSPAPFLFPQDPKSYPSQTPEVQQFLTKAIAQAANAVLLPAGTFNLVAGQATYLMGPGAADFNTTRPLLLQSGNVLLTQTLRYPLALTSAREWAAIRERGALSGRPLNLYYDNAYPTANLNLWPVPTAAATFLELFTWQAFAAFGTDFAQNVVFPPAYAKAFKYSLAVNIAPRLANSATNLQLVIEMALGAKATVQKHNAEIRGLMLPQGSPQAQPQAQAQPQQ